MDKQAQTEEKVEDPLVCCECDREIEYDKDGHCCGSNECDVCGRKWCYFCTDEDLNFPIMIDEDHPLWSEDGIGTPCRHCVTKDEV